MQKEKFWQRTGIANFFFLFFYVSFLQTFLVNTMNFLREFTLQIIRLESERTQWEQRYLEETAMRQVAIDAASIPKDAKIAALEKTSAESEKLIADARNDKMRQFEEMQLSQVNNLNS